MDEKRVFEEMPFLTAAAAEKPAELEAAAEETAV